MSLSAAHHADRPRHLRVSNRPSDDDRVLAMYDGATTIDGVAGTAAPIKLSFLNAAGSKTGILLPSGKPRETIEDLSTTLIDYAMPMLLLSAAELGLQGNETPATLDASPAGLPLVAIPGIKLESGRCRSASGLTGAQRRTGQMLAARSFRALADDSRVKNAA